MGQRHQIFVKIINPTKYLQTKTKSEKAKLVKQFGTGEFSILAYHNQWLFGRSALQNALNLLEFGSQFTHEEKTSDKPWGGYNTPLTPKGIESTFNTLEKLTTAIAFVMNFRAVKTPWLEAGFGSSFYIGEEDEGINFDFTKGDNNDGITIIDLVENKYCFMNISEYDRKGELAYNASDLPKLYPVSAEAYVKAYYGETIDKVNPYYLGDHDRKKITKTKAEQEKIVSDIAKVNKKALKGFEKFELLTIDEIGAMFGQMEVFKQRAQAKKVFGPHGEKITLFKKK